MINIQLTCTRNIHFLAGLIITFVAMGAQANEAAYKQYQQKKSELATVNGELDRAKVGYQSVKIEMNTVNSKLDSLQSDVNAAKAKLDKLRNFEDQNPEMDFSDKIGEQRGIWKKTNQEYLSTKEYIGSLNTKVREYKTQYDIALNKKKNLEATLQRFSDDLAGAQVNEKLKQINKSKRISIKVRETCSLNKTKDQCRDQARVKAERQAAEQGSLVVVDTVTEIKNFNLTKDEARSRVSARVSDIKILKDTFDLTADKSGWQVDYEISALVTPVVTAQMREELKQQAMASLNSGVAPSSPVVLDASPVQAQSTSKRQLAKEKQQAEADAAQKQLESEMMARQSAAQELEIIKEQASKKAAKEVSRQDEEEEASRRKRVYGGW